MQPLGRLYNGIVLGGAKSTAGLDGMGGVAVEIKLLVIGGNHAGKEIPVRRAKFAIGRAKDCHPVGRAFTRCRATRRWGRPTRVDNLRLATADHVTIAV